MTGAGQGATGVMNCSRVQGHGMGVTSYKPTNVMDSQGRTRKTPEHVFMHHMSLQRTMGRNVQK